MTHEAIIEKVKKKYAGADEATIHAVLQTLQDVKVDWRWPNQTLSSSGTIHQSSEASEPLKFVGEHLTFEQYRQLSIKERGEHQRQLKAQNRRWLKEKFANLHAAWLMILDGEVIAFGDSLMDYPSTGKLREIGLHHGKRPFLIINELLVAIEESGGAWHSTVYRNDYYPAVHLALHNDSAFLEIAADFDTGAASSFADYDLLLLHSIIDSKEDEQTEGAQHLSQTFEYISKFIIGEIKFPTGEVLRRELPILCVADWKNSPFININPQRTALAGRNIFLELQPAILLDFANRRTKMFTAEQV